MTGRALCYRKARPISAVSVANKNQSKTETNAENICDARARVTSPFGLRSVMEDLPTSASRPRPEVNLRMKNSCLL